MNCIGHPSVSRFAFAAARYAIGAHALLPGSMLAGTPFERA